MKCGWESMEKFQGEGVIKLGSIFSGRVRIYPQMNRMDADQEDEMTVFSGKTPSLNFLSLLLSASILFICGFFPSLFALGRGEWMEEARPPTPSGQAGCARSSYEKVVARRVAVCSNKSAAFAMACSRVTPLLRMESMPSK